MKRTRATSARQSAHAPKLSSSGRRPLGDDVRAALAWLVRHSSKRLRHQMGPRYGIITRDKTLGVSMANIQTLARQLGRNHALAAALWDTGCYEARLLASFVDEPARVTPAQMDRWARDFDNWGVTDTVCFKLFDQVPHAFAKAAQWAERREEFIKRAGFALMACLALHNKTAPDKSFLAFLPLIEKGAHDERNFVKKGVSWALRAIGGRSSALKSAALAAAKRLAASQEPPARWVGKDALRAFASRP